MREERRKSEDFEKYLKKGIREVVAVGGVEQGIGGVEQGR